jgi:hypothetical protein
VYSKQKKDKLRRKKISAKKNGVKAEKEERSEKVRLENGNREEA